MTDSKTRGSRTGTWLKGKVFKAQASRKAGVKRDHSPGRTPGHFGPWRNCSSTQLHRCDTDRWAISRSRYKMVIKMCEADLEIHGTLMDDWSEQISWLWTRCQPEGNQYYIAEWDQMIQRIGRGNPTEDQPQVEEQVEATVLEVDLDDGKDADVALIAAAEGDVSNDISNDSRNNGPAMSPTTSLVTSPTTPLTTSPTTPLTMSLTMSPTTTLTRPLMTSLTMSLTTALTMSLTSALTMSLTTAVTMFLTSALTMSPTTIILM
ncbi:hypothetical protein KEM48_009362 [Puccinia striiformis f. sp. tritici PST-130]|nr:hypothetical protein KEM48_009362 [Puccinia striiformis f. sp. tritici PST-130]